MRYEYGIKHRSDHLDYSMPHRSGMSKEEAYKWIKGWLVHIGDLQLLCGYEDSEARSQRQLGISQLGISGGD